MLGGRILVADAGDNRVMVWNRLPRADGVPCDFVLGQADMPASITTAPPTTPLPAP